MERKKIPAGLDPETLIWAKIWLMVPIWQHQEQGNEETETIEKEISLLRSEGKLTKQQMEILDKIGMNSSMDVEEF